VFLGLEGWHGACNWEGYDQPKRLHPSPTILPGYSPHILHPRRVGPKGPGLWPLQILAGLQIKGSRAGGPKGIDMTTWTKWELARVANTLALSRHVAPEATGQSAGRVPALLAPGREDSGMGTARHV